MTFREMLVKQSFKLQREASGFELFERHEFNGALVSQVTVRKGFEPDVELPPSPENPADEEGGNEVAAILKEKLVESQAANKATSEALAAANEEVAALKTALQRVLAASSSPAAGQTPPPAPSDQPKA